MTERTGRDERREAYQQRLLVALRLRDVPGPRIAEALAEVDSHLAESGEDPYEAFGSPNAYADRLAGSLGGRPGRFGLLRSLTWADAAVALVALVGAFLLTDGLYDLVAGDAGPFGLPPAAALVTGALMLAALTGWLVSRARRGADRVLDPRTGRDMARPAPRWALAVTVGAPVGILLIGLLASLAAD